MKCLRLLAAATLIIAPMSAQAKLSGAESRIVRAVDQEQARTLGLLENLVNQNSGSLNLAGVEAVGRMMRAELEPLGFEVRWVPMAQVARAGHIVAIHRGSGKGRKMLLIGHLDTVFEPDSPFQHFARKDADTVEGPGVGDDKGGMAVMVAALRAMKAAGTLAAADIEIVLTGDEEDAGNPVEVARGDLIEAGKRADVALDFEGLSRENGQDMGSISRRGSGNWEVRATGRTGHSSGVFSAASGNGAIYELSRILTAFRTELPEPNLTFNVGLVVGGATAVLDANGIRGTATGKTNIIPEIAIAKGDIRALSLDQYRRVTDKMRAIVARHMPGSGAEISFDDGAYPPMAPTAGGRALLDRLNLVNRDLGLPEMAPIDPLKRGAGDIGFVAEHVDGLVGLGPAGGGSHAPGETVDVPSLWRQAKRAAILMTRLSAEKP
ncbi:M20/M25/M40 family metallo-hydrolase [Sphingosinicella sp. BN140058]|uniref:M20/M25/M40 family metallo-hydrolase n=1 Tax=Sphingosinicella sp. BN140058 TaxID=1892855 RepID=UPI001012EDBB|nr:M20/M25/M40 family metallo-hydrolase [Sphingosinicella sp. BN140058]QAY76091.1 M20 family peptidase [Sphingosinicella sp. BN140058]